MRLKQTGRRQMASRPRSRPGGDGGAVATLVAVVLGGGVLLGMGALSIDVGQLYAERAELQSGADAAAIAVAQDCADGDPCDSSTGGLADTYADGNARKDSMARLTAVCGDGGVGGPVLPACPAEAAEELVRCIGTVPAGAMGWVEARTATDDPAGGTLLPPTFAQAMTGNAGYAGTGIAACARAAWGAPASASSAVAVTISLCEWEAMTGGGTVFPSPERALYLHSTPDATTCPSGPAGSDLPGGFGWLAGSDCEATMDSSGWVVEGVDPGNNVSQECKDALAANLGQTIYIPIFVETNDLNGTNGNYLIDGFAAFVLTGYHLPGTKQPSILTGSHLCSGPEKCLYGYFTEALVPTATFSTLGGTYRGATVVGLVG